MKIKEYERQVQFLQSQERKGAKTKIKQVTDISLVTVYIQTHSKKQTSIENTKMIPKIHKVKTDMSIQDLVQNKQGLRKQGKD